MSAPATIQVDTRAPAEKPAAAGSKKTLVIALVVGAVVVVGAGLGSGLGVGLGPSESESGGGGGMNYGVPLCGEFDEAPYAAQLELLLDQSELVLVSSRGRTPLPTSA